MYISWTLRRHVFCRDRLGGQRIRFCIRDTRINLCLERGLTFFQALRLVLVELPDRQKFLDALGAKDHLLCEVWQVCNRRGAVRALHCVAPCETTQNSAAETRSRVS